MKNVSKLPKFRTFVRKSGRGIEWHSVYKMQKGKHRQIAETFIGIRMRSKNLRRNAQLLKSNTVNRRQQKRLQ